MTDYQKIRAAIEGPLLTAFNSQVPAVPVYFDNITFVPPDPPGEYVRVNVTFGMMTESTLVDILDRAQGAIVVRCFAQRNRGPARCQELVSIAVSVLKVLARGQKSDEGVFVRASRINGPSFPNDNVETVEPGQHQKLPHFQGRIDAAWQAVIC